MKFLQQLCMLVPVRVLFVGTPGLWGCVLVIFDRMSCSRCECVREER